MVYPKIVNELEDDSDAKLVESGDGEADFEFSVAGTVAFKG